MQCWCSNNTNKSDTISVQVHILVSRISTHLVIFLYCLYQYYKYSLQNVPSLSLCHYLTTSLQNILLYIHSRQITAVHLMTEVKIGSRYVKQHKAINDLDLECFKVRGPGCHHNSFITKSLKMGQ